MKPSNRYSTKVISLSLQPSVLHQFDELAKQQYMNRSEFLRRLLEVYNEASLAREQAEEAAALQQHSAGIRKDAAQLLRAYWELQANSTTNIVITGLGIFTNFEGKVLIANRQHDQTVDNLSWGFPGGQLHSLDFAKDLKDLVLARAGCSVRVGNLITARIFPDTTDPATQIITLYFACQFTADSPEERYDSRYNELKWIKPMDVFQHFTSSASDDITHYLAALPPAETRR